MKLEFKHLKIYLEHELKIKVDSVDGSEIEPLTGLFFEKGEEIAKISNTDYYFNDPEENDFSIAPILKPLSDLIDNILDDGNDENYQLNCELADLLNTTNCDYFVKALIEGTYYAIDHRLINNIEFWLNKNHFDWKYNLIENRLAFNINYLKK